MKPDSGEREVCGSVIANVNGALLGCDLEQGHAGAHTASLAVWLAAHGRVVLPLPLAQRILAALEEGYGYDRLRALASELRAEVERKP